MDSSVWKYVVKWSHSKKLPMVLAHEFTFDADRQPTDGEALVGARLHLDEQREFTAVIRTVTVYRVDTYMMGTIKGA